MIEWIAKNWEYLLIGFYVLEKMVKLTKWKWDDIIVDGFKSILMKLIKK